jgi:hypothetical protein
MSAESLHWQGYFRIIQRMGHPLKLALFSFIIGQHEQAAELVDDTVMRGSEADWVLRFVVRRQNRGSSTSIIGSLRLVSLFRGFQ